jgi:hypothetical protein
MKPRQHPTKYNWGRRKGRPWTDEDERNARFMAHLGVPLDDVARELKRSRASVRGKIGMWKANNNGARRNLLPEP